MLIQRLIYKDLIISLDGKKFQKIVTLIMLIKEKSLYKMDNSHGMIILLSNMMNNIIKYSKMQKNQKIKTNLKNQIIKTITNNKLTRFKMKRKIN
jgi:hypothetical protein